ncbi:hypothetical protein DM02DRAFT_513559 [Periconia macrospinosa]|uniref:NADH-ubiquinone oxidoreductase 213 kDa subunit n=1 Tax=Periconia macrospinosa TaxID=97972 RepID=A0A2V1EBA1_9PLEO|nr:hypothetical protein DM02DRAFT_513559 [Periconia macrospinosa]
MAAPHESFHPRDTIANTLETTAKMTVAGLLIAGVQNTMRKTNVGPMGIVTRSGGVIALFAGVGASYQFTLDAAANLRQKDDTYNDAIAGFAAGVALGIPRRSMPFVLGAGVCGSTVMAAYRYTNGLKGYDVEETDEDEVERKENLRKQRRRPLQETLDQLGEGRGIYGPGYEERRRERLLKKYGIDVKEAQEQFKAKNVDSTASL